MNGIASCTTGGMFAATRLSGYVDRKCPSAPGTTAMIAAMRLAFGRDGVRRVVAEPDERNVAMMRRLAQEGKAILMVSSELPEVLGMSDRVIVMRDGRIAGEMPPSASEEQVLQLATGARGVLP